MRVNARDLLVRLPLEAVMITCTDTCCMYNMLDTCIIDNFYLLLLRAIFLAARIGPLCCRHRLRCCAFPVLVTCTIVY